LRALKGTDKKSAKRSKHAGTGLAGRRPYHRQLAGPLVPACRHPSELHQVGFRSFLFGGVVAQPYEHHAAHLSWQVKNPIENTPSLIRLFRGNIAHFLSLPACTFL